jgi:hypothetical protein
MRPEDGFSAFMSKNFEKFEFHTQRAASAFCVALRNVDYPYQIWTIQREDIEHIGLSSVQERRIWIIIEHIKKDKEYQEYARSKDEDYKTTEECPDYETPEQLVNERPESMERMAHGTHKHSEPQQEAAGNTTRDVKTIKKNGQKVQVYAWNEYSMRPQDRFSAFMSKNRAKFELTPQEATHFCRTLKHIVHPYDIYKIKEGNLVDIGLTKVKQRRLWIIIESIQKDKEYQEYASSRDEDYKKPE